MAARPAVDLYLDLLRDCLTDSLRPEAFAALAPGHGGLLQLAKHAVASAAAALLDPVGLALVRKLRVDPEVRARGEDWPERAETLVPRAGLDQLRQCIERVLREGVPGDLVECGVWRGGATIFMRGVLEAHGDSERAVWVVDSFRGVPPPAAPYPADAGDRQHRLGRLAVGIEEVKANFARYGLLDARVRFLPGWFRETLPAAPIGAISVLRSDGDLYESTMQVLTHLYPRLSPGGFCVIDDYGALPACRQAVDEYRRARGIGEPLQAAGDSIVYWRRAR